LSTGCGACHAVRGTEARGVVGPDLTHVGSRLTLAAGALPNDPGAYHRWLGAPGRVKPLATMPSFGALADGDRSDLALYLKELQ
ncbi:MAG: c-type cytochrome, partial [Myxococcaceae bacterium]|nr:c-type cytochrome [Myxococcaceae bacterium]